MADTSNFDAQKALSDGASEDDVLNFLSKRAPQFNTQAALKNGSTKRELIDFLASNVKPPSEITLKPFVNPDINKPVRKIDAQGADLPNRQQNDPRLIQPQDINKDNGVVPGAQTGATMGAALGFPAAALGDLGAGAAASTLPKVLPKLLEMLKYGALGGGASAISGHGLGDILKSAGEGALLGPIGGSLTSKILRGIFSKAGPEAGAAMSEVPPIAKAAKGVLTQEAPVAPSAIPQVGGSTFNPQSTITPPITAPSNVPNVLSTGSTAPALAPPPPAPVPPAYNLVTGKMLKKGADTLTETKQALSGMSTAQLDAKAAKLTQEAADNKKRADIFQALKAKYGIK